MGQYDSYPQIWAPPYNSSLFVVKVPQSLQALDEQTYKILMVERLDGMIQSWLDIATLEATQSLLALGLSDLHPFQDFPLLTQNDPETFNLWAWRLEWAEAFILHNSTFSEALWLTGMGQTTFPTTPFSPPQPQFEPLLEVHQDTHLEAWLMALSATLQH